MADVTEMPKYDGMEYEELVVAAQYMWMENAKLRELCKSMRCALVGHDDKVYLAALDDTLVDTGFDLQKLRIGVDQ